MKLTTIALAMTLALPSTYAFAKGGMGGMGMHASHAFSAAGRIASRRGMLPGIVYSHCA